MIDNLTMTSCSKKELVNGEIWRKSYVNSESGRAELAVECTAEEVEQVMAIWGDAPTVVDVVEPEVTPQPTEFEQLRADVDYLLMIGGES